MSNMLLKNYEEMKRHPVFVLSAVLIPLMILMVYWHDLSILVNEAFNNEALTHIVLVPILFSYIVYRKRDVIKATFAFEKIRQKTTPPLLTELVGLSFCLSALLLYWYGSSTFYPLEYHLLSLPLFLTGICFILFNLKTVIALIFPILFLLFIVPTPSEITYTAGGLMGNFDTQASYTLLKTIGLPVTLETTYGPPTIAIATSSGTPMLFAVDLACSGIYSLIAFIMFALFLSYIIQGSLVKKVGFFFLGFVLLQILNIIRISTIVAVGYWFGEEIAMAVFHVAAGWILIFGGMLLLLLIGEKVLHLQLFRNKNETQPCSKCNISLENYESFCSHCGKLLKNLKVPTKVSGRFLAKTAALLVGLFLVASSIQAPVFAFAQGITFTNPSLEETTEVFPEFADYQFKFLYRDTDYEKLATQDASLVYAYIPVNTSGLPVYVDIGISNSISSLHNWEVCYVAVKVNSGQTPVVSVLDSRDVQILGNPPIIGRYFVFESPNNYTQTTLYWYEKVLFNTGLTIEQKFVRISLIMLTQNSTAYTMHEEELLTFAQSIANYWEPLKEQSSFSLSVPLQQVLLAASVLFIAVTGTTQYLRKWRKKKSNLKIFEKFVSSNEKLFYQTLKQINEGAGATIEEIAQALEQATGKSIETEEVSRVLNHLQENGLVETDIITVDDKPKLVWKP